MKKIFIAFAALAIFIGFSSAASAISAVSLTNGQVQPGDVVINEIMWMGSEGRTSDEWIELKNMTGSSIDLSGWVVENLGEGVGPSANITIPAGKNIPSYGFFLISNDPKETSAINIDPDFQTLSVSLKNTGEQLILKNHLGEVIDTANQAAGTWFAGENPASGSKKSMERNSPPGDGTLAENWHSAAVKLNLDEGSSELATPGVANISPLDMPTLCKISTNSWHFIIGTPEDDNIIGTNGNDMIFGLEGDDRISGGKGVDCIIGGEGEDKVKGGDGIDYCDAEVKIKCELNP